MYFRVICGLTIVASLMVSSVFAQGERNVITVDNAGDLTQLIRLGRGSADSLAFSPDGSTLAAASSLGVWLYDVTAIDTQSEPPLLVTDGEISDVAYNPTDGTVIVSNNDQGVIEFWNDGSQTSIFDPEYSGSLISVSPDGKYLALNWGSSGLFILDIASQTEYTRADTVSLDSDTPIVFFPDSTKIAVATNSYIVAIWDLNAGGEPLELTGHTSSVDDIAISPDGSLIATASGDRSIKIWNAADGSEVATMTQGAEEDDISYVYAVTFSPDGTSLLTGHSGNLIRVWDVASATETGKIQADGTSGNIDEILFSPDGSQFAARSTTYPTQIQLFSADGTHIATAQGHNQYVGGTAFNPDSSLLIFSDVDDFLYMWDTNTVEEITFNLKIPDGSNGAFKNVDGLVFSSDGQYLATADGFNPQIRNPETGELILDLDAEGLSSDMEFSPDNTMLAYASSSGLYIFDVATGALLSSHEDHNDWLNDVAWSPDQTMIATSSTDHSVRVYTVQ